MSKIAYSTLKLKTDNSVSTFDFQDKTIEVLNYLGIDDKYDLIMITLQKSESEGTYDALKLEMYFHLHLVYMYTNLSFTEKQKENEGKLYDALKSNGFIDEFLKVLKEDEYNFLFNCIQDNIDMNLTFRNSAGAVLQSVINDLPKNAQIAADIVDSFDKDKYAEVVNFAKAAGNKMVPEVTGQD